MVNWDEQGESKILACKITKSPKKCGAMKIQGFQTQTVTDSGLLTINKKHNIKE